MEDKWYPGHIAKAKRRIGEKVKAVNAVIEMIDARIPYSGRAYEWRKLFYNKFNIILLTKSDLADQKVTEKWVHYYQKQGVYCISLSLKDDPSRIKKRLQQIRGRIPSKSPYKRAMITGIPNVGKSTLINKILNKKSMRTGNTPGVTKGLQWINVSDDFLLLDTPGILYSNLYSDAVKYKLLLTSGIKATVDIIDSALAFGIKHLMEHYPEIPLQIFGEALNPDEIDIMRLYEKLCQKRGFLLAKGEFDIQRARTIFLKMFQDGTIGKISLETPDLLLSETMEQL
ncbi:MAG: ribosome biosis GTPase [Thermotogaceae bacterium]|jgi:ribosome biogenesis GTPase A|nr:ribosome biosis GTPase [Thermotogaceae bacterium]